MKRGKRKERHFVRLWFDLTFGKKAESNLNKEKITFFIRGFIVLCKRGSRERELL